MLGPEWDRLMREYRDAVQELDSVVKRSRRLLGKEFEDEQKHIETVQKKCEAIRRAMREHLK